MRSVIFAIYLLTSPIFPSQMNSTARIATVPITGRVVDKDGHPVGGATVAFFPFAGLGGMLTFALDTQTDAAGKFTLTLPPLGDGWLRAMKLESGFPDAALGLYGRGGNDKGNASITLASVKEGTPNVDVTLRFGDPDALIDWTIRSHVDHSPLANGSYKVALTDNPGTYQSANVGAGGHFIFVLPKRPVTITISSPGYKDWSTADDPDLGQAFTLKPGTRQRRDIYLKKIE